jgi:hypothetical protein
MMNHLYRVDCSKHGSLTIQTTAHVEIYIEGHHDSNSEYLEKYPAGTGSWRQDNIEK